MIPGEIVGGDYQIIKRIGEGSFGFVYKVRNRITHEFYAIKTDQKSVTKTQLQNEVAILKKMQKRSLSSQKNDQNFKNICLGYFFSESSPNKMLMPLHGENLFSLFHKCNTRFDSRTIYQVSKAMLKNIQTVHNLGFIHKDIKPQNFVAGRKYDSHSKESIDDGIYLVDFGLAQEYLIFKDEKESNQHIKYQIGHKIRGTLMYMSINVMLGIQPSRRDDLQSLMYIMILFIKGRLPWHNINVTRKNFEELVMAKISIHPDDLFSGLPNELKQTFIYIRKLKFEETPNYKRIMNSFECLLSFKNAKIDQEYGGRYRDYCWEVMYEKENMKGLAENVLQLVQQKQQNFSTANKEKEYTLMCQ